MIQLVPGFLTVPTNSYFIIEKWKTERPFPGLENPFYVNGRLLFDGVRLRSLLLWLYGQQYK